jgi:kumamolisin
VFRAPSSALRLPAAVASVMQAVGGLQTNLRLHPQASGARVQGTTATCAGASDAQSWYGGELPQNLSYVFGFGGLQNSDPGTGEKIGLVEFSAFSASNISTFDSCVSGITSGAATVVPVDGGTSTLAGQVEAVLDIEVAQSTAPAAPIRVYEAPNDLGDVPDVIQRMASDGVTVASDSWGLCEPLAGAALLGAENNAFQIAAVGGMSFFAASGDDGASDCRAADGSLSQAVDDPASQPFVTGVGGTTILSGTSQRTWTDSGGGVSAFWTQPGYQSGAVRSLPAYHCTNSATTACREVPDIAMDANPNTGFIVYCHDCFGSGISWFPVGGTSMAAPLAAGLTALANEYSLANGGQRMGFANPFLYATRANTGVIEDITTGPSNNVGGGGYLPESGYDMVTGLGSMVGTDLGPALAAYSGAPVSTTSTTLSVTSAPASGTVVAYPHTVTIAGKLVDSHSNPIDGAPVHVLSYYGSYRATTNASGDWSITFAPRLNAEWIAEYTGSDTYGASSAPSNGIVLLVRPELSATAALPYSHGRYHATAGRAFTISGGSSPNMSGASVSLQYHVAGSRIWHFVKTVGVGPKGGYSTTTTMPYAGGARYYRWYYTTHPGYRWQSATSPTILITTPS